MEHLELRGQIINSNAATATIKTTETQQYEKNLMSVGSKIWKLIEEKFPYASFTSSDIQEMYEDKYNKPVQLSIISTYLSRYCERGKTCQKQKR